MANFSSILANLLNSRGLSQKWLADNAETTEATISRYIKFPTKSPDTAILVRIASVLGVTTDYLLGVTEYPFPKESISEFDRVLLDSFRIASYDDKKLVSIILRKYMTVTDMDVVDKL